MSGVESWIDTGSPIYASPAISFNICFSCSVSLHKDSNLCCISFSSVSVFWVFSSTCSIFPVIRSSSHVPVFPLWFYRLRICVALLDGCTGCPISSFSPFQRPKHSSGWYVRHVLRANILSIKCQTPGDPQRHALHQPLQRGPRDVGPCRLEPRGELRRAGARRGRVELLFQNPPKIFHRI